jgi:IgA Peptidase M64
VRRTVRVDYARGRALMVCAIAAVAVAIATIAAASAAQDGRSAKVVPLQVTGDPAARFSLVVLGDGYTAAEIPKFRAQVDKHLNVLWSIEPFRSYRSYINVYAVEIVSGQSGITCDPEIREKKATPLRTIFSGGCTNPNARGITIDENAAKSYASRATPHFDQILVLANTDTYGGIGGVVATTSGGNSLGPLITPHEIGHSLGKLRDEYTYSARGKPGGPYSGDEPDSPHMTLLTEDQMRQQQRKWWRWLGEISESGGVIGRFEGGSSRTTGIWRPSKHSMMISIGYYFDQVSRERMTERISAQVALIAAASPTDAPVGPRDVIWIETAQPVYHDLDVTWQADGKAIPAANGSRYLNLATLGSAKPSTVTVTVTDPTEFVRDPEIKTKALTTTRTWKIGGAASRPGTVDVAFTASTQTGRPVGGRDVVSVVTTHPRDRVLDVVWRLNGEVVANGPNSRALSLARLNLPAGTHKLVATVEGSRTPPGPSQTREWVVDNAGPIVGYALTRPIASVAAAEGAPHYFMRDEFTMKLDATDDQPGYVVAEFRVNGDGWHHYYGWPDAPPGTPYRFTPRGTTIKELVYGSLSSEGLSPQPWEPREPGWGTHRIEYRGIDAAGNIGAAKAFRVTLQPAPACNMTITAPHSGDLQVDQGVFCVTGTTVSGTVTVLPGASLVAVDARFTGSITSSAAARVELINSTIGDLRIEGSIEAVTLFGSTVTGKAALADNRTPRPIQLIGNAFRGAVACSGNSAPPDDGGTANTFEGGTTGQCGR